MVDPEALSQFLDSLVSEFGDSVKKAISDLDGYEDYGLVKLKGTKEFGDDNLMFARGYINKLWNLWLKFEEEREVDDVDKVEEERAWGELEKAFISAIDSIVKTSGLAKRVIIGGIGISNNEYQKIRTGAAVIDSETMVRLREYQEEIYSNLEEWPVDVDNFRQYTQALKKMSGLTYGKIFERMGFSRGRISNLRKRPGKLSVEKMNRFFDLWFELETELEFGDEPVEISSRAGHVTLHTDNFKKYTDAMKREFGISFKQMGERVKDSNVTYNKVAYARNAATTISLDLIDRMYNLWFELEEEREARLRKNREAEGCRDEVTEDLAEKDSDTLVVDSDNFKQYTDEMQERFGVTFNEIGRRLGMEVVAKSSSYNLITHYRSGVRKNISREVVNDMYSLWFELEEAKDSVEEGDGSTLVLDTNNFRQYMEELKNRFGITFAEIGRRLGMEVKDFNLIGYYRSGQRNVVEKEMLDKMYRLWFELEEKLNSGALELEEEAKDFEEEDDGRALVLDTDNFRQYTEELKDRFGIAFAEIGRRLGMEVETRFSRYNLIGLYRSGQRNVVEKELVDKMYRLWFELEEEEGNSDEVEDGSLLDLDRDNFRQYTDEMKDRFGLYFTEISARLTDGDDLLINFLRNSGEQIPSSLVRDLYNLWFELEEELAKRIEESGGIIDYELDDENFRQYTDAMKARFGINFTEIGERLPEGNRATISQLRNSAERIESLVVNQLYNLWFELEEEIGDQSNNPDRLLTLDSDNFNQFLDEVSDRYALDYKQLAEKMGMDSKELHKYKYSRKSMPLSLMNAFFDIWFELEANVESLKAEKSIDGHIESIVSRFGVDPEEVEKRIFSKIQELIIEFENETEND